MWNKTFNLILLISPIFHLIDAKPTDFEKCCRYGFEDGVKLNMLRDNKKWSVIRSKTFGYCETQVLFGLAAYRKCKIIGEEMAINCNIGKYYALLGFNCSSFHDENPAFYACCMTCSNGQKFAEEEFQLFENKTNEIGEELFKSENLYLGLKSQIDKDLTKYCKFLNLVLITPELQLSTFSQCCRSWAYNYNQNFYPDHFNLNDTCNRIDICLEKQNHTQFNFNEFTNRRDIIKLKTENIMKIVNEQMKWDNESFDKSFDEIKLSKSENRELRSLDSSIDYDSTDKFHNKKLRSLEEEKKFHSNQISSYELSIRKVPLEKLKYHYCNKFCKDAKQLDYKEMTDSTRPVTKYKELIQCFHNYSEQFCAQPIECDKGFIANHNNTKCVELNECEEQLDDCLAESENCVNYFDGYACECKAGYRYDFEFNKKCINIDECTENSGICPSNSYCKDLEGSYECDCFEGLFKNEFGQCSPFFTKIAGNNKDNKKETTTYFTPFPVENKEDYENEDKRLAEKIKAERELREKLKNGQFFNGRFLEGEDSDLKNDDSIKRDKEVEEFKNQLNNSQLAVQEEQSKTSIVQLAATKIDNQASKIFKDRVTKLKNNSSFDEDIKSTSSANQQFKETNKRPKKTPEAMSSIETNLPYNNEKIRNDLSSLEKVHFNPCPNGYFLNSYLPEKCIDIDECSNSTLNNCNENQKCVNLPGKYECAPKDECPKNYKDVNLDLNSNKHHLDRQLTRTSTICKYNHEKAFSSNEERISFEKENSIIQFIVFDTTTLPFSNASDYEMIIKDKKLAKADGGRLKSSAFIFYLIDKNDASNKAELNFKSDLKIKATTCKQEDLTKKFELNELNSNVFAIFILESIKESCSIDLQLELESDPNYLNYYNRELYNIHLIIYDYKPDFTIVGNLVD